MSGEREQLKALLIALWEEDAGESLDGIDVSEPLDAYLARLLPVVERIAAERAAAELRAIADASPHRNLVWMGDVEDGLRARANALDPS